MKTEARVTVTVGRRGRASAASRGWQSPLSRYAGEAQKSDALFFFIFSCCLSDIFKAVFCRKISTAAWRTSSRNKIIFLLE